MSENSTAIIDDRSRLTYLTRHYYDLQGLRLAPLWIAFLLVVLVWMPYQAKNESLGWGAVCSAVGGFFACQVLWYCAANWYYRRLFGWLKPDPLRFTKQKTKDPLFFLLWLPFLVWAIYCRVNHSSAFFPYLIALFLSQAVLDRENPPIRRVNYGVGAGLITLTALLNQFTHLNGAVYFVTLCGVMLALGIADHLLLLGLFAAPNEETDA